MRLGQPVHVLEPSQDLRERSNWFTRMLVVSVYGGTLAVPMGRTATCRRHFFWKEEPRKTASERWGK
jgi:hypothetical protein